MNHIPRKKLLLAFGDAVLFSVAYCLAPILVFRVVLFAPYDATGDWLTLLIIYLFTFYVFDLYDTESNAPNARYLFRVFIAGLVANGLSIVVFFFAWTVDPGRDLLVVTALLATLFTFFWRILFNSLVGNLFRQQKRLLIVGAGRSAMALYDIVKGNPAYEVVGFVDDDVRKHGVVNSPSVLGGCGDLDEIVEKSRADEIAVTLGNMKHPGADKLLKSILNWKVQGINVHSMPSLYEEITGKIPVRYANDAWFVNATIAGVKRSVYNRKIKRILDVLFSLTALTLVGLPLFLPLCLAITLDSPGPVFYRQKRSGFRGRDFRLIKFRSMSTDAEASGAVWATRKDPRATRVGRIIRKLRIDEIPQMFNVLKGDMSFIGPRPERPEFVKALEEKIPYYGLRHYVKPGITGWAQVSYPYGASEEDALEKLQYDLFYIKNLSPFLDFHILLRTVRVVLFGKGAR